MISETNPHNLAKQILQELDIIKADCTNPFSPVGCDGLTVGHVAALRGLVEKLAEERKKFAIVGKDLFGDEDMFIPPDPPTYKGELPMTIINDGITEPKTNASELRYTLIKVLSVVPALPPGALTPDDIQILREATINHNWTMYVP